MALKDTNIMDMKKGYSIYLKFSTILMLSEESKRTDMTKSDIVEAAILEYVARNNENSEPSTEIETP